VNQLNFGGKNNEFEKYMQFSCQINSNGFQTENWVCLNMNCTVPLVQIERGAFWPNDIT
jgi:hypothetical protein